MKIFEVTFDNGKTHTIKLDNYKSIKESLQQIENSGTHKPWTIINIIRKK